MRLTARRDPFLVGAVVALCVLSIALGAVQIKRYREFGRMRNVAASIETARAVSPKLIGEVMPKALDVKARGICQADYVKAALTVVLTHLDQQNSEQDFDSWSAAMVNAEEIAKYAIGCSPTNGNFWLRLAMVRQAISEQSNELARLVQFSQLYAPAEEKVIGARYRLYNRVTAPTLALLGPTLASDLTVICDRAQTAYRRRLPAPDMELQAQISRLNPDCSIGPPVSRTSRR